MVFAFNKYIPYRYDIVKKNEYYELIIPKNKNFEIN
jgi:hypothetical protein